jgi:hypothetical protein
MNGKPLASFATHFQNVHSKIPSLGSQLSKLRLGLQITLQTLCFGSYFLIYTKFATVNQSRIVQKTCFEIHFSHIYITLWFSR